MSCFSPYFSRASEGWHADWLKRCVENALQALFSNFILFFIFGWKLLLLETQTAQIYDNKYGVFFSPCLSFSLCCQVMIGLRTCWNIKYKRSEREKEWKQEACTHTSWITFLFNFCVYLLHSFVMSHGKCKCFGECLLVLCVMWIAFFPVERRKKNVSLLNSTFNFVNKYYECGWIRKYDYDSNFAQ